MAIEKMTKLDIVGHIEDLNRVCRSIVLSRLLHPTNALQEIVNMDFTPQISKANSQDIIDVNYLRLYSEEINYAEAEKILKNLKKKCMFSQKPLLREEELILDYNELMKQIDEIDSEFLPIYSELDDMNKKKETLERNIKNIGCLKNVNVSVENLLNLNNFCFEVYRVSKENMLKLKGNYENIPSIVLNVFQDNEYNMILAFTPSNLKTEADRILKSLNCEIINLPAGSSGFPSEILKIFENELDQLNSDIKVLKDELKDISEEKGKIVYILEKSLELEMKLSILKNSAVRTNDFFYLCGWIPEELRDDFLDEIEVFGDRLIVTVSGADETRNNKSTPPTRLKNNFIVRPFEVLVKMYGTPMYKEIDPTIFFGISYMLMFGLMFGDLGQGLVFLAVGLFLKFKKRRPNLGGVIARLGISSSLFGLAYGSFFGFENIIPALIIRPMENITNVLLYAIAIGCGLLIIGFVYGVINNIKKGDLENGCFSKNGAAGLTFYLSLLIFVCAKVKNVQLVPTFVWIIIFVILFAVMLLKQPMANLILKKKPLFNENKSDYFIEGGFGFVELLLSMLSNTISFIRMGAFALNHVGLFMAFESLAGMMRNSAGSAAMYILGNLIIIGLEGLVVFIQSLRLEYYELFSKYYEGSGKQFEPVKLSEDLGLSTEKSILNNMDKKIIFEK